MEYFCNNGNTDSLSITDMIECDIKSGFSENMRCDDPLISSASSLDGNLASNVSLSRGYPNQNGLTLVSLSNVNEMDLGNGTSDDGSKSDLAWMQTVNLADIQDMIVQVQPENTNPNLLVNPQTGLPVTACQQLQPQSPNVSTVTITHGTVGTSLLQAQDQVQYIATPVTTIPQSQSQSFIPQNSVPLQTIQNTVSQMSSSIYPQSSVAHHLLTNNHVNKPLRTTDLTVDQKVFPKPVYSYSCLIAMALKNSDTGALPVSEIYSFMTENFPYFKTAPDGWKNSVRHNLSLNKCFEKIENPKANGNTRKGCLWGLNPAKVDKMDEEIAKWRKKDLSAIKRSMAKPDVLDILERGKLGSDSPHHPNNIKNGHRPITGNIDITITRVGTGTSDAVNTAISSKPTCVTSMARQSDAPQISLIEIKPSFQIKEEAIEVINRPGDCIPGEGRMGIFGQIKGEENCIGALSNEDFNMLDNHLALDPSLSEFALQNGLWEEFSNEMLNLDDNPTAATSSLNLNLTTAHAVPSSPSASQMALAAVTSANSASSPLVALLTTNVNGAAGAAGPQNAVTPAGNILISRTISAQT